MTFENASAAWWALVAVPVLILYFLRLAVHRETVGTGMFWRHVLPKTNPFLRRAVSLIAQLMLISLLVAGLAMLYLAPDVGSRRIVVVIDNSPSMAALSSGKSRRSLAIDEARKLISKMRIGDEMAIFVNSPYRRAICRMTGYRKQLYDSLSSVALADQSETHFQPTALTDHHHKNQQMIFIGDACLEPYPVSAGNSTVEDYIAVGESLINAAITRLAARRVLLESNHVEVMIEVQSFADDQLDAPLFVTLDGAELAREQITLPPNSVWRKTFRIEGVTGGKLTARLDYSDGLVADNVVSVELPPVEIINVKVEGTESESWSRALAAIPQVRVVQRDDEQPSVMLFHGQSPPQHLDLPALVINPTVDSEDWDVGQYHYDIEVTQDESSPLVRGVSLDEAVYERVREFVPHGDYQAAASGKTGTAETYPLLFSYDSNPRRVVFAVDLEYTDLVNRRDLPKLLTNILVWLVPQAEEYRIGTPSIDDHELRPSSQLSAVASTSRPKSILDYPWWYWPCWYLSIVLAVALLPLEWWLYQRRIIA